MSDLSDYIRVDDFSKETGVSRNTIYKHLREGGGPRRYEIGRGTYLLKRSEALEWMRANVRGRSGEANGQSHKAA